MSGPWESPQCDECGMVALVTVDGLCHRCRGRPTVEGRPKRRIGRPPKQKVDVDDRSA